MRIIISIKGLYLKKEVKSLNGTNEKFFIEEDMSGEVDRISGFITEFSEIRIISENTETGEAKNVVDSNNGFNKEISSDYFHDKLSTLRTKLSYYENLNYNRSIIVEDEEVNPEDFTLSIIEVDEDLFILDKVKYKGEIIPESMGVNTNNAELSSDYYSVDKTDMIGVKGFNIINSNMERKTIFYSTYKHSLIKGKFFEMFIDMRKDELQNFLKEGFSKNLMNIVGFTINREIESIQIKNANINGGKIFNYNKRLSVGGNLSDLGEANILPLRILFKYKEDINKNVIDMIAETRVFSELHESIMLKFKLNNRYLVIAYEDRQMQMKTMKRKRKF